MRAAQRDRRIPGGVGTLVLDNPFGKANYRPFVDLQRRVAAAHGIQLLLHHRIQRSARPGPLPPHHPHAQRHGPAHQTALVQILDRYGDAVAAGVARAQDDGITSAHLLRRAVLHTETEPDAQAPEQEAG